MFFKKKKEKANVNNTVNISTYCPNQNIRPVNYESPKPFLDYKEQFIAHCKERLSTGALDQFCFDYMDEEINAVEKLAKEMLLVQDTEHQRIINTLTNQVDKCDLETAKHRLNQAYEEKKVVRNKIELYEGILYRGTILDNGLFKNKAEKNEFA